jgi:hypothetical protein
VVALMPNPTPHPQPSRSSPVGLSRGAGEGRRGRVVALMPIGTL